jgi:hypothetical protein
MNNLDFFEVITNVVGATILLIISSSLIISPKKVLDGLGRLFMKFGKKVSPFHEDSRFEVPDRIRPLAKILGILCFIIAVYGVVANLLILLKIMLNN